MKIKEIIEKKQISYLKNLNISIIKSDITYNSDKVITYFIDLEVEKKEFHIVITCNWLLNTCGIHFYSDKNFKQENSEKIFNTDDLNEFVTKTIVKNIYN